MQGSSYIKLSSSLWCHAVVRVLKYPTNSSMWHTEFYLKRQKCQVKDLTVLQRLHYRHPCPPTKASESNSILSSADVLQHWWILNWKWKMYKLCHRLSSEIIWGRYHFAWFTSQNECLWARGLLDSISAAPSWSSCFKTLRWKVSELPVGPNLWQSLSLRKHDNYNQTICAKL